MSDDAATSEWVAVPHEEMNLRAYRAATVAFVVAVAGGLLAAAAYWTSETQTLLGVGLALALGGIGFGLVSWAKYLDLDEHVVQQREPLRPTAAERDELTGQVE
ncbi:MAG: hypothetical protein ABJ314_09415, partial [Ilumatobacter sp.]